MQLTNFLLAFLLGLAPISPVTVTLNRGSHSASIAAAEEGSLLSVADFVAALGGSSRPQPGGSLAVEIGSHRIVAADGVSTVAFDDRVVTLAHPTRSFSRVLYAPWEFFEKTVLPAAGISAIYALAAHEISARAAEPSAPAMEVTVIHSSNVTQIVFRTARPVAFEGARVDSGYNIVFKSPVVPSFSERDITDPFVTKIDFSAGGASVTLKGKNLSVNPYTLKNPDRIVLEIVESAPPVAAAAPAPPAVPLARTVVIDPGHGGDETGAVGPGDVIEKEVNLDIARRLSAVLAKDSGIRTVLTRSSDVVVALDERAAIANHEKAAVFVSIHANSSRASGAHGSETYYLSLAASDKLADALARQENAADGASAAPEPAADAGLDFILWDLAQSAHLKESAELAESIQNELNALLQTENRGIKQAPFRVLVGAAMPAVLVETGFISNSEEARKLARPEFRQSVADAIARALWAFLRAHPAAPPPANP